ncbi:MAG: LiaI-LiaF-like domain-containing protein [Halodesulfurarchaeum sp.]
MARLTSQVWAGIVVILVGVLLLLDTTGLIAGVDLSLYIPSVFVLVGVYALIRSGFRSIVGPVLVIVLAGAWQLSRLELLPEDVVSTWWPLLLVVIGAAIIVSRWRATNAPTETDTDRVDVLALFGGAD